MKHSNQADAKGQISIKCDYCEEILTSSFRLKTHYKNLHPGQPVLSRGHENFECTKCPDFFFMKHELEAHLNIEHGVETEKKYCKCCRVAYKDVHNCAVKKQRMNRTGRRNQVFPCNQCMREFSSPDYLSDHVKSVHENRLDYECQQCKKKFVSKNRLAQHIFQTHSSQVNCDVCDKKISNPAQLKRHKVFAHNETDGAVFCVHCPKSVFFSEQSYRVHMENKHGYNCSNLPKPETK